ncbi:MAG: metal ABC transporter solute-binding protein, Zn/Mn family [Marinilabiliaceae bacterium]
MFLNFSAGNRRAAILPFLPSILAFFFPSCSTTTTVEPESVTVSNPAMAFFVRRLVPADFSVNVMIPQGADHDTYTPRPSQMAQLAKSKSYVAYGPLEFELTWKKRIVSAAPDIIWSEVSDSVDLIYGPHHCSDDDTHANVSADPHFWVSPRQAAIMSRNVARSLKLAFPSLSSYVDSALVPLLADVAAADSALSEVANRNPAETFVVYHPALAYVARDYGLCQLSVASESAAPTPRMLAILADSARRSGAKVFFLQSGVTPDKVESLAAEMGTRVVTIQPESADWLATMGILTSALR